MLKLKTQMIKTISFLSCLGMFFAFSAENITVADEEAPDFSKYKKLKYYEPTGKKTGCVRVRNIQSTSILDEQTILFKMRGKKAYVNKMDRRCAGMHKRDAFSYTVHTSQLCKVDMIHVFDPGLNMPKGACGLGEFYEFKKLPLEKRGNSDDE